MWSTDIVPMKSVFLFTRGGPWSCVSAFRSKLWSHFGSADHGHDNQNKSVLKGAFLEMHFMWRKHAACQRRVKLIKKRSALLGWQSTRVHMKKWKHEKLYVQKDSFETRWPLKSNVLVYDVWQKFRKQRNIFDIKKMFFQNLQWIWWRRAAGDPSISPSYNCFNEVHKGKGRKTKQWRESSTKEEKSVQIWSLLNFCLFPHRPHLSNLFLIQTWL